MKRPNSASQTLAAIIAAAALAVIAAPARAASSDVSVGVNFSLTGADADSAARMKDGALLGLEQFAVPGVTVTPMVLDDGTATAGQYDPAQAATNARKMVSDKGVVAAIGPQMSGAGKAMAPILSQGDLAIITPSSTNPDLTDPKFAAQYMPGGKAIYFRTVSTDNYQGPNLANYFAEKLNVKSVYVLDDSGAYGVGIADAFQAEAKKKGIKVMGRDQLDPKAADYTAVLTKIKSLNPDALYYGGVLQAGVKVIKQSYDIIPKLIKGGGDGLDAPETLTAAGFPAAEGWYVTIASPHLVDNPKAAKFVADFKKKFNMEPDDYSITSFDAAHVIMAAIKTVKASGKPITRAAVRDAIQAGKVTTLQGPVSFDQYGDLTDKTISIFQVKKDTAKPLDSMADQFHYVGVAPES